MFSQLALRSAHYVTQAQAGILPEACSPQSRGACVSSFIDGP
jgi:hypothetical protein